MALGSTLTALRRRGQRGRRDEVGPTTRRPFRRLDDATAVSLPTGELQSDCRPKRYGRLKKKAGLPFTKGRPVCLFPQSKCVCVRATEAVLDNPALLESSQYRRHLRRILGIPLS